MRILIFHGYLLRGTGSNIYNVELAAALVRAGHEVHLLCQERDPFSLPWVDAVGDWDEGELRLEARRSVRRATVYRPNIGGLLPVYVADKYEGITARPFPELSESELNFYLESNIGAVREVVERVNPDLALANHLVMGPVILARALRGHIPYVVKIHGSALEYTVKPYPRFLPFAREGLAEARTVFVGSQHTANSLLDAMDDPGLAARVRLGPPGVNIERFSPRGIAQAKEGLTRLRRRLEESARVEASESTKSSTDRTGSSGQEPSAVNGEDASSSSGRSSFARDVQDSAKAIGEIDLDSDRLVVFLGKFIGSKGVELLLAAWPLVLERVPNARLLLIGFGEFEQKLRELLTLIERGDLAQIGSLTSECGAELTWLSAFISALESSTNKERYLAVGSGIRERVSWLGRLDHDELEDLLPVGEVQVVPSTFPEAFGMVAIEGAACGAFPVVANHSGLAEVSNVLARSVDPPADDWLSFDLGDDAIVTLADNIASFLTAPLEIKEAARDAVVRVAREQYSWDRVAETVVTASEFSAMRFSA